MVNLQTASSTENNAFVCYFQVRKHTLQLTIELDYPLTFQNHFIFSFVFVPRCSITKGCTYNHPWKKILVLRFVS